jgi:putative effector of murein hydrolase
MLNFSMLEKLLGITVELRYKNYCLFCVLLSGVVLIFVLVICLSIKFYDYMSILEVEIPDTILT